MPYKDPAAKRAWELRHRAERVARRHELRRIEAAKQAQPPLSAANIDGTGVLFLPLLTGAALAAYRPKLALGAGGLTLVVAALYKKDWRWWVVGILILALGIFFQWNNNNEKKCS